MYEGSNSGSRHGLSLRHRGGQSLAIVVVLTCLAAVSVIMVPVASGGETGQLSHLSSLTQGSVATTRAARFHVTTTIRPPSTTGSTATTASTSSTTSTTSISTPSGLTPTATTSTGSASSVKGVGITDPDLLGESLALQQSQLADIKTTCTSRPLGSMPTGSTCSIGGPTSFDWSQYDQLVAAIQTAEDMSIDFIIDGTASWASASGALFAQPTSSTEFGTWAGDVAARYGSGGPTSYEIWNEPNSVDCWTPAPNPAHVRLRDLIAAYQAIKAVEPDQTVLTRRSGTRVERRHGHQRRHLPAGHIRRWGRRAF